MPASVISSAQIRRAFLDYFSQRGHREIASSSLVPASDPTLLFTNAGMVQFKDVFLGAEQRSYRRAATSQRCVRAGGKHNDLDQVGYTARHHTFFEMLGNFSFGDYFKQDAIRYAWEFLTDVAQLPAERLWVTVYQTDDEAYEIWANEIGVPDERIIRIGDKPGGKPYESDNFWAMGDTGPCGPCSEIFYDHGASVAGGPPGSPDEDGDRYIEIWNLVFMQFDRDEAGELRPLPKPCVDTGMGLERLAAVLQRVHSNYDIDLFRGLIDAAAELTECKDLDNNSLKVIADHVRACGFLIIDGVLPSNEGRGYVLRRIIRRAVRHGYMLGQKQPFFHRMVAPLVEQMGDAYPELAERADQVAQVLQQEEERFGITLEQGMKLLTDAMAQVSDGVLPGAAVFKLYDTYGFPADLTADVARERGLTIDQAGFDSAMAAQRHQSQQASNFSEGAGAGADVVADLAPTEFVGYSSLSGVAGRVLAIVVDREAVSSLEPGTTATVILDRTPFYAESGGQVGDVGELTHGEANFAVRDTQKMFNVFHAHQGELTSGVLKVGDDVIATIDSEYRASVVLNHSGTHLLHAALREVLGTHVEQKGSLVAPDRLRFDFAHNEPVTTEQLRQIEQLVNEQIRGNIETETAVMAYDEAIAAGAMALFGEKYGDEVRVLRFGEFSTELCGGTHVDRVGEIGILKITNETGIASGVRRIEAVTGQAAMNFIASEEDQLISLARMLKISPSQTVDKVRQLLTRASDLEKQLTQVKAKLAGSAGTDLAGSAKTIHGIKLVAAELEDADAKTLRDAVDQLKSRLDSAAVVLASVDGGKVRLVAGVTKNVIDRIRAGDLVNHVAVQVGGKGGGRADLAQAGGNDPAALAAAIASVESWVTEQLTDSA